MKNFDGVRLPSAEDTYLARVVAKDNPNDVRLIAMAELRDVTPRRDSSGTIISFPAVEAVRRGSRPHPVGVSARRLGFSLSGHPCLLPSTRS